MTETMFINRPEMSSVTKSSQDRIVGVGKMVESQQCLSSRLLLTCPLYTNSGCGKKEAHINWSMVMQRQYPLLELP